MASFDPHTLLADHGDYLFRVARRQLRSDALAEDAVQETLLAALSSKSAYTGAASLRTWLTGILKHKIVDAIRCQAREVAVPRDEEDGEDWEALFKADGHWQHPPLAWRSPESDAELAQLRVILLECSDRLKPAMARVFSLREVVGMETEEICKELGISATNCWVLLHRARLFLRECLELNGFTGTLR